MYYSYLGLDYTVFSQTLSYIGKVVMATTTQLFNNVALSRKLAWWSHVRVRARMAGMNIHFGYLIIY
jgi:hypothetical protein